jgi:hypothetical protein
MNAHWIVIVQHEGEEKVVLGMCYPPQGQKPIGYDPKTYLEVTSDAGWLSKSRPVYLIVGKEDGEFHIPFPCPTEVDAKRWASLVSGARVEFIP